MICVHGLARNGRDFDYLAKALETESQVFCPDIAGRGKSEWLAEAAWYNYAQYLADMAELIARADAPSTGSAPRWAASSACCWRPMDNTPIRRLVVNDVGPFIPLAALQRIGTYVAETPEFADAAALEKYIRTIYASFGNLSDENWRHLATHSMRKLPDGKLALAHDPAIAEPFLSLDQDIDFWSIL